MNLEPKILALIALGTSVSTNCRLHLEHNLDAVFKRRSDPQRIAEVVGISQQRDRSLAPTGDAAQRRIVKNFNFADRTGEARRMAWRNHIL